MTGFDRRWEYALGWQSWAKDKDVRCERSWWFIDGSLLAKRNERYTIWGAAVRNRFFSVNWINTLVWEIGGTMYRKKSLASQATSRCDRSGLLYRICLNDHFGLKDWRVGLMGISRCERSCDSPKNTATTWRVVDVKNAAFYQSEMPWHFMPDLSGVLNKNNTTAGAHGDINNLNFKENMS